MSFQRILLSLWFALGLSMSAPVIAGSLTAEIDKASSSMDEPFWLTIAVQGSLDGEVIAPETKDFELTRSGESTNISIINGSMTKEHQYSYQVRALKEGSLTIPSFKAKVDGEDLKTIEIKVEVKGGTPQPSQQADGGTSKKFIFVERELPKTTFYEGEAILSKVRLLTRVRISGATPTRDPAPDWRMIGTDKQSNADVNREGMRWTAVEMNEGLIPLKPGKLKVPSFGINATWVQPTNRRPNRRSVFDMFQNGNFNMGEEVSRKLVSEPIDVVVKPLPLPKPADFSDMVGAFTITSSVSKMELNPGETATVTIEIKGQGALDRMRPVKFAVPGARVYDDKPKLVEKLESGAGLVSSRTLKFAVVPNAAGSLELGTLKFASFNPFTEKYETLEAKLGTLVVSGSSVAGPGQAPSPQAQDSASTNETKTEPSKQNPALEPAAQSPQNLAPKVIGSIQTQERAWYLGPVALAIEIFLIAAIAAWIMVRRGFLNLKASAPKAVASTKNDLNELIGELELKIPGVADRAYLKIKQILANDGQDPSAMTSRDLLKNAELSQMDDAHLQLLRHLSSEFEERAYGGAGTENLNDSFLNDLKSLMIYIQSRSF